MTMNEEDQRRREDLLRIASPTLRDWWKLIRSPLTWMIIGGLLVMSWTVGYPWTWDDDDDIDHTECLIITDYDYEACAPIAP